MSRIALRPAAKIEIWSLQDNYIEMTAMDNNAIITRAAPLKDGNIKTSILAEHGFSALVKTTSDDKAHTLLFDFGFSEDGAFRNATSLGTNLSEVEAAVLSHGHSDHTGGMALLGKAIGNANLPLYVHPCAFISPLQDLLTLARRGALVCASVRVYLSTVYETGRRPPDSFPEADPRDVPQRRILPSRNQRARSDP